LNKKRIENVDKKRQQKGKKALLNLIATLQEDK